jgi:hypothetical protein
MERISKSTVTTPSPIPFQVKDVLNSTAADLGARALFTWASCSDAIKAQVRSRLSAAMVAAQFSRPPSYYSDDNYYKTLLNGRLKVLKRRMEKENQVTEGLISFAGEEISPHHIHDSPEVTQQRLERFLHRFHHVIHQYETNLASGIYVGYTGTGREIT